MVHCSLRQVLGTPELAALAQDLPKGKDSPEAPRMIRVPANRMQFRFLLVILARLSQHRRR